MKVETYDNRFQASEVLEKSDIINDDLATVKRAEKIDNNTIKAMVAGHICLDITPGFNPQIKNGFKQIFAG